MKNKCLKEALEETVKEIQGFSKEELEQKLSEAKESTLARTIDEITKPEDYAKTVVRLSSANPDKVKEIVQNILSKVYHLESKCLFRECSIYITEQLHFSLRYNVAISEELFKEVDFKLLSTWSLIALLRNTIWSKEVLPRWYDILDHTVNHYEQYNLDKRDLFGLIKIDVTKLP